MEQISRYRTVLMGFSALWIYYFHIVPAIPLGLPLLNVVSGYLKDHGFCGVDILLLLSGFGLACSFAKKPVTGPGDYGRYLVRRLRRIFVVIVPAAAVIALADHWTLLQLLGRCTGIWQLATDVYDFLWFVPCILLFYLLTPFYYALYRRLPHRFAAACAVIAVWIVLLFLLRNTLRSDLYAIANRVPVFLLGICMGDLHSSGAVLKKRYALVSLAALVCGVAYSFALSSGKADWYLPAQNALVNLLIAPGIVVYGSVLCSRLAAVPQRSLHRLLQLPKGVLEFYGRRSLEFYAVQEWIWLKMQNSGTLLRLFASSAVLQQLAAFALTTLAALILHGIADRLTRIGRKPQSKIIIINKKRDA